jgi:hypothetical protein
MEPGRGSDRHEAASKHHNGAAAPLPHNQMTEDEIVAEIVREFDAIELTDDCVDPLGHAPHHEPHPDARRTVSLSSAGRGARCQWEPAMSATSPLARAILEALGSHAAARDELRALLQIEPPQAAPAISRKLRTA